MRENRETSLPPVCKTAGRRENAMSGKSLVNGGEESYRGVVPAKQPNKGEMSPAEVVEERPRTEENTQEPDLCRTPGRESGPTGLERVREAADVRFDAKYPTSEVGTVCVSSASTGLCGGCEVNSHPYRDPADCIRVCTKTH